MFIKAAKNHHLPRQKLHICIDYVFRDRDFKIRPTLKLYAFLTFATELIYQESD